MPSVGTERSTVTLHFQERIRHRCLEFTMHVIMGNALQVANQPLKWETPPGPSGAKQSQEIVYVKGHMSIDYMVTGWMKVLQL